MKKLKVFSILLIACVSGSVYAQHEHLSTEKHEPIMSFSHVLTQGFSDPEIASYKMESVVMMLLPHALDTVAHRHDCELFGYVLDGEVEIGLDTMKPQRYSAGQMFYEKRNILHASTLNPHDKPARILLIFIIKNGRARYTEQNHQTKK
jgi:quercetin dioxygenase-like cupin family protein